MTSLLWARRIAYLCVLLGALMGQLFDIGWIFHYIFFLVLTLPVLSLLLSLPGILGLRVRVRTDCRTVRRNEHAVWTLALENRFGFPAACVTARVRIRYAFTGKTEVLPVVLRGASPGVSASWRVETGHCGMAECSVDRVRAWDCLGLFALPLRVRTGGSVLVVPLEEDPGEISLPESSGVSVPVPKGKASMGEDYELRPYRPGDSMRSVHWKMSAKRDDLITRELLAEKLPTPVLTFDHFGAPDQTDRILDRLAGYSRALLERERPFEVRWVHPVTGAARRYAVGCERDWWVCLAAALSDPAPETGQKTGTLRSVEQDEMLYQIHIHALTEDSL